uniref:Uncharacterized protein n=1 Tax=Onchocerca volvulus TaxID=6282 RepID=A0A8R1TL40_ONCVO
MLRSRSIARDVTYEKYYLSGQLNSSIFSSAKLQIIDHRKCNLFAVIHDMIVLNYYILAIKKIKVAIPKDNVGSCGPVILMMIHRRISLAIGQNKVSNYDDYIE